MRVKICRHQNILKETKKIRQDYENCVKNDGEHFLSRINDLDDRGLLEDTLVIYTSDHGELLGEGGMLGHNAPMRPELVRIPAVLIHPDLDTNIQPSGVIRHIDILPTILDILQTESNRCKRLPGQSLATSTPVSSGPTFYEREFFSTSLPGFTGCLEYNGVWDQNGGHVFSSTSLIDRVAIFGGKLLTGTKRRYLIRNLPTATRSYLRKDYTYDSPQLDQTEAQKILNEIEEAIVHDQTQLSDEAIENLRDLGYR
jgi:hypothetical protein